MFPDCNLEFPLYRLPICGLMSMIGDIDLLASKRVLSVDLIFPDGFRINFTLSLEKKSLAENGIKRMETERMCKQKDLVSLLLEVFLMFF